MEDFKGALALDPNHTAHNVHLHLGLCKILVKLGRGKDALISCAEALKIDEELIEALVQVCYCFDINLSLKGKKAAWILLNQKIVFFRGVKPNC